MRRPVAVVRVEIFYSRDEAFVAERKIKGWTREKKETLIREGWQAVGDLKNKKNT